MKFLFICIMNPLKNTMSLKGFKQTGKSIAVDVVEGNSIKRYITDKWFQC